MTKICPRKQLPEWKWWRLGYAANHIVWRERVMKPQLSKEAEGEVLYRFTEVHSAATVARIMQEDRQALGLEI